MARDNTVSYLRLKLQLPESRVRAHYVKARVKVRNYPDGTLAVFHGPRCIARYDAEGHEIVAPTRSSLAPCSPPSRRGLAAAGVWRDPWFSAAASLDCGSTRRRRQSTGRDEETGNQVEQRNNPPSPMTVFKTNGSRGCSATPGSLYPKRTTDVLQKPDNSKSYRQAGSPGFRRGRDKAAR